MNNVFEKEFDFILEKTKTLSKPMRVVVAGADAEHLLQAVFEAEAQGFAIPVLVGDEARIQGMLKELNLENRKYEICGSSDEDNIVQDAIDVIRNGRSASSLWNTCSMGKQTLSTGVLRKTYPTKENRRRLRNAGLG